MLPARFPAFLVVLCSLLLVGVAAFGQTQSQSTPPQNQSQPAAQQKPAPAKPGGPPPVGPQATPEPAAPVPSPTSRHYPILIVAHGNEPSWSLRIGMKGPERLDRLNYPPIVLEPGDVTNDQPTAVWTYNAKDSATGAAVAVKLTREPCSDNMSDTKYTFRVDLQHAQIGTLTGCGVSSPEKFPEFRKKNQIDMPDNIDPGKDKDKGKEGDKDKEKDKKTVLEPITKFQSPIDFAFLDSTGRVIVMHGAVRKTASTSGSDPALSHDGKKLAFTYSASKTAPDHSLLLFEYDTGRSRQIAAPDIRDPFWSPDDSHIAYLKSNGQTWQIWTATTATPENATLLSSTNVNTLDGWFSPNTVIASDLQNAYWISEDRPAQTLPLKDIYGSTFQVMSSDSIRVCPVNPDLLLVSAYYANAPAGSPTDSTGLNETFFLYEIRSKRRTVLGPPDAFARNAEWSRDGLQIFFTKGIPGKTPLVTDRIFWDGTGQKKYVTGTDLVVGR